MNAPTSEPPKSYLYRAFISYSHSDKSTANWLHSALERYRLPQKLVGSPTSLGPVPQKLSPIFRDQDELPASGNLGAELHSALAQSQFLIVICSPASARSKWVNEEIRQFKAIHGTNKVLALVVDGEPNASAENVKQECFAPALKVEVDKNGTPTDIPCEPIAADLRPQADGKRLAKLKLISGLTGLRLDDLVQREAARRVRTLVQISIASATAAIFAIGLAIYANQQRLEANAQREIAEQESATATAVSDFLVDIFASGQSVNVNPNEVTARSILDRGATRIATELRGQPVIQNRLSRTIGLAYSNLGLFSQAIGVIDSATELSLIQNPSNLLVKAYALMRMGELSDSLDTVNLALSLSKPDAINSSVSTSNKDIAGLYGLRAMIYYYSGEHKLSMDDYANSLRKLESEDSPDYVQIAKTLLNRSLLFSDTGEFQRAIEDLDRAMKLAIENLKPEDTMIGQIYLAQAQVNFLSGNLDPAKQQIDSAIANLSRILEEDNPSLADAYSMQGQILHALGELNAAHDALTRAVEIYTHAYKGRHYLSGIAEVYLGLIAGDQNDLPSALAHFEQAKQHYDAGYGETHANHGDLLVNQATVLAKAGEIKRAQQDCLAGMEILNTTLGKNAAFTQQLQAICDDIQSRESAPST